MSIILRGISKSYGGFKAVDNLTIEVPAGRVFAFLGPNGAGKTTTIKMITGLLLPDSGMVEVCGYPMGIDGQQAKAQLAYVPDQPFLYEKLTAREFLRFVADMYRLDDAIYRRRSAQLIEQLDIGRFCDQLAEGYSHGMKQRVVLAAALLHDPTVLIVDEPMVGLDPRTMRIVKDIFRQRARDGHTVFMSTHTLDVVETVADQIAIIHRGRLLAGGTLAELREAATHSQRLEDIFLKLTEEQLDDAPSSIEPGAAI
jgi:ABC-2 type transport system ATP-binding protein